LCKFFSSAEVRIKDFQGGINLYEKTLAALPPKEVGLKIRVTYNMILAYVRRNDLEKADELLKTIPENFISPVMGKVRKLQKKVRSAMMQDRDVVLDSVDEESVVHANQDVGNAQRQVDASAKDEGGADQGQQGQPQLTSDEMAQRAQEHAVFSKAGERCCHMIYHSGHSTQPIARQLLANMPVLKIRVAIQKEEGFLLSSTSKGS
jgi:hypothetical protein